MERESSNVFIGQFGLICSVLVHKYYNSHTNIYLPYRQGRLSRSQILLSYHFFRAGGGLTNSCQIIKTIDLTFKSRTELELTILF